MKQFWFPIRFKFMAAFVVSSIIPILLMLVFCHFIFPSNLTEALQHIPNLSEQNLELVHETVKKANSRIFFFISMTSLLCVAIVAHIASGKLTHAITTISKTTKEIAEGNLNVTSVVKSNDEILELSENINKMIHSIQERELSIKNYKNKLMTLNKKLKESNTILEQFASLDGLTQLFNRRSFDSSLESEWRRALRNNKSIALIMIDIDFFKNYNDLYGHQQGDQCLKTVAQTIKECTQRGGDYAARYGGEEFVIILPETDMKGAISLAEKVRTAIESLNIIHKGSKVNDYITVSLGVSSTIPINSMIYQSIIEEADKALYQSKKNGRNRVTSHELSSI